MTRRKLLKSQARLDAATLRRIATGKTTIGKRSMLHDGSGLYLHVRPEGSASWVFRYMRHGRPTTMGLGSLAHVGAPQAREMARLHRAALATGGDPLRDRRARRPHTTFRDVAEQVLLAYATSDRHVKTQRSWRQVLEDYAYPVLGDLHVDDIEQADVLRVVRPLWKIDTGRKLRARIEHVMDEARLLKLTDKNPARYADLRRALAPFASDKPRNHHKALPWRDMPALMARLRSTGTLSAYALRLLILSATRTNETRGAAFPEFSNGMWTIPAERMKARREHRIPISTGIAELLEEMAPARERGLLLFANSDRNKPLSEMTMSMALKNAKVPTSVHGLRSTFRDWAGEHGYPSEIAEAALAHHRQGVEGAYFRSDLFEARRDLMEAWSRFCLTGERPKK